MTANKEKVIANNGISTMTTDNKGHMSSKLLEGDDMWDSVGFRVLGLGFRDQGLGSKLLKGGII